MAQSGVIRWYHNDMPEFSIEDIMGLTRRQKVLSEQDMQILEGLLRYNFFTTEQVSRLWLISLRMAEKRMARLYQWGLVDRGSIPASHGGRPHWAYALSARGFDVLVRTDHTLAREWTEDWRPKSETGSQRVSTLHELGLNDVCIAICETAKALGRPVVDWEGSREAGQKFVANKVTHEWQRIDPDAVILLDQSQPLMIEYERSGRDTKFHKKLRAMRSYLVGRQWQTRYPREPWVVYAIPAGTGTQGVVGGSFGGMALRAELSGARNYLLLDEDSWVNGTWTAMTGDGTLVNFWDTVSSSSKAGKAR